MNNTTVENNTITKLCKRCVKLNKPNPEKKLQEFPIKTKNKLSDWCKDCHKEYSKEHYKKNADKIIAKTKEWQKNNKDKIKKYTKTYRDAIKSLNQTKPPEDILNNILPISPQNQKD